MKYTKGPWIVVPVDPEHADDFSCQCNKADGAYSLNQECEPGQEEFYSTPTLNEVEGNCNLMAAAPELLDALNTVREYLHENITEFCFDSSNCQCEGNGRSKNLMELINKTIRKATGGSNE